MSRKNANIHDLSPKDNDDSPYYIPVNSTNESENFSATCFQMPNVRIKSSLSQPVSYKYKIRTSPLHSFESTLSNHQQDHFSFSPHPKDQSNIILESQNYFSPHSLDHVRQSSNASFSSISSELCENSSDGYNYNSYKLCHDQYVNNSSSKHLSPNSFKNRLSFWEEKSDCSFYNDPCSANELTSPFGKLSDTSLNLRMKRSSYAPKPSLDSFISQDSNFNASNTKHKHRNTALYENSEIGNVKNSYSYENSKFNKFQGGLYVANSMKEAKMHVPIDSLLQSVVDFFDSPVYEVVNSEFINPYSFFLAYKWTRLTSEVLACKLRLLFSYQLEYTDEGKLKPLAELKSAIQVRKLNVAQALRFWIRVFPEDFQPNSLILDVIHSLKEVMRRENQTQLLNLLELQYFDTYTLNKKLSLLQKTKIDENTSPTDSYSNLNHQSFEILKISSSDLAKIIVWMEFSLFKNIPFAEFQQYSKSQSSNETQNINISIKESNAIAMWIKSSILKEEAPDARALIIEKFIDVAIEIRKLHAFQSLMSFVGALNSGCICPARLALTWGLVPKEKIRMFNEFTSLLTMHNNYSVYRAELEHIKKQVRNFYFPILGVIFKDLIQLDSKPNSINSGAFMVINEKKLIQIAKTIETWRKSQNSSLPKSPNYRQVDLVNAAIHLCSIIDEDELYRISFELEPNEKETSELNFKENEIFSAFIKNFDNKDIEPAIVKFHVQAMTKAIFSSYDKDHNGFLTEGEFALIQKNFPFIQNFNQLDKNRDGLIGHEEVYVFLLTSLGNIKDYFTHSFREFHEIHPTLCSHCRSMMWCPIEAACKCRDCDIICHKHCKDNLVAECKPKGFHMKRSKIQKQKHPKSRLLPPISTERFRHHSATELTDEITLPDDNSCNILENVNHNPKSPVLTIEDNSESISGVVLNATNEMFVNCIECENNKIEISRLSQDNIRLRSQLNTALFALYRVKSDNQNLKNELDILNSQLSGNNSDLHTNNVELQRQFVNVRNATGEFLLQQVAILNSSKSETYL